MNSCILELFINSPLDQFEVSNFLLLIKLFFIFCISLILNIFLFSLIRLGIAGNSLKLKVFNLIEKNSSFLFIIPFLIFLFIIYIINSQMLFLDNDNITAKIQIESGQFVVTGDALKTIFENLGSAGVFSAGCRVAYMLVGKTPNLSLMPKAGMIGGLAAGFTMTFKVVNKNFNSTPSNISIDNIPVQIELSNLEFKTENKEKIKSILETHYPKPSNSTSLVEKFLDKKLEISGDGTKLDIISQLDKNIPDWRNSFVNSPLESADIKNLLLENLTDHLLFHFIILYLIIMLCIIITCKFYLEGNIQLTKNHVYVNYVIILLNKYISIWKTSGIYWIYLIIVSLIIFNVAIIFSLIQIINYLNLN